MKDVCKEVKAPQSPIFPKGEYTIPIRITVQEKHFSNFPKGTVHNSYSDHSAREALHKDIQNCRFQHCVLSYKPECSKIDLLESYVATNGESVLVTNTVASSN